MKNIKIIIIATIIAMILSAGGYFAAVYHFDKKMEAKEAKEKEEKREVYRPPQNQPDDFGYSRRHGYK